MTSSDWPRNAYTSAMPSAFRSAWSLSNGPEQEGFEEILDDCLEQVTHSTDRNATPSSPLYAQRFVVRDLPLPYRRRYLPLLQHILTIVFPDRRLSDPTEEFQGVH